MVRRFSGPATILGGLPVFAEIWFARGDGWTMDNDAGVDMLYWLKPDGTKGAPLPQSILDRLERLPWWQADVCDAVFEHCSEQRTTPDIDPSEKVEEQYFVLENT